MLITAIVNGFLRYFSYICAKLGKQCRLDIAVKLLGGKIKELINKKRWKKINYIRCTNKYPTPDKSWRHQQVLVEIGR